MSESASPGFRDSAERDHELQSARRAASVAARHEALAEMGPAGTRDLHQRMALIHRQTQRRHLVTARLYGSLAVNLQPGSDGHDLEAIRLPLVAAAAELAGSAGAIIALFDAQHHEVLVLTSDETARSAHEVEFKFGEGPCRDAFRTRQLVAASGQGISDRWQLYGPGVADLDVREVAAVPMALESACLGSLTLLNPAHGTRDSESIGVVGDVLVHALLDGKLGGPVGLLLQDGGDLPSVHQAAGVISARTGCSIDDALALIRARAFAESSYVGDVAHLILDGRPAG